MRLFTVMGMCVVAGILLAPVWLYAQTPTLTLSDTTIERGDRITVEFDAPDADEGNDWIGLYRPGANPRTQTLDWDRVQDEDGEFSYRINSTGTYEIRYYEFPYTLLETSRRFTVVNNLDDDRDEQPTLSLSDTKIETGDRITVEFDAPDADEGSDWIGLYRPGANPRTQTLDWDRVQDEDGSFSYRINTAGTYEIRYYQFPYTLLETSERFTVTDDTDDRDTPRLRLSESAIAVGDRITVEFDAPDADEGSDWIGLYRPGANPRTQTLDWDRVQDEDGEFSYRINSTGTYEIRYYAFPYTLLATSEEFTVSRSVADRCTYDTDDIANFPPPNGRIVAFGDSITAGVGASANQDYVAELEKRLGVTITNAGVPGDTTRDALQRLQTDVLRRDPGTVIVFLGGNDEIRRIYEDLSDTAAERRLQDELEELADRAGYDWRNRPLIPRAETYDNLEEIIGRIQDTGATTILVGFDATIFDDRIDDDYERIARRTDSLFVPDIYDGIFGRPRFMSDLIHPNNAGYDIVADRIERALACTVDT